MLHFRIFYASRKGNWFKITWTNLSVIIHRSVILNTPILLSRTVICHADVFPIQLPLKEYPPHVCSFSSACYYAYSLLFCAFHYSFPAPLSLFYIYDNVSRPNMTEKLILHGNNVIFSELQIHISSYCWDSVQGRTPGTLYPIWEAILAILQSNTYIQIKQSLLP